MSILSYNIGDLLSRDIKEIGRKWEADMEKFHRDSIERIKQSNESYKAFNEKLKNQNAEYDAVLKEAKEIANETQENMKPLAERWEEFKKGLSEKASEEKANGNTEYVNFYQSMQSDTNNTNPVSDSMDTPQGSTDWGLYNYLQLLEMQTGVKNPLSPPESTRSSYTSERPAVKKAEYTFADMMAKRAVDSARDSVRVTQSIAETHSRSAERRYTKAIEKMGDPSTRIKDVDFWKRSADQAKNDMKAFDKIKDDCAKTIKSWE